MMFPSLINRLFQRNNQDLSIEKLLQTAITYHSRGELDQAKNICQQILQKKPDHADSLHLLGVLTSQRGQFEQAVELISQAIELNPGVPDYYNNLGRLLYDQGRLEETMIALEKALQLKPDFYDAQKFLGIVFKDLWLLEDARAAFEKALNIRSDDAEIYDCLGLTLHLLREFDEAKYNIEKAIQIRPDYAPAYNNLAVVLQALGNFEEAKTAYDKALQLSPNNPNSIAGLAYLKKFTPADLEFIDRAESVLETLGESDSNIRLLYFALGKMLDDCGEFDRAFSHYEKANTLNREEYKLDPETEVQKVSVMIETFTPDLFEQCRGFGDPSRLPVFIVGMPRSGTSLVEQIIASHPQVYGAGELTQIGNISKTLHEYLNSDEQYPECMWQLDKNTTQSLVGDYLALLRDYSNDTARVTDKMPANFVHLGLISILFPQSYIIHCRRDPLDVCLSMYFNNMAGPQGYAFRLSDVGYWYRQYERLMDHWKKYLPIPILDVHYEELVNDQKNISRDLTEYLELDWDEHCVSFHETKRTVLTASNWQVKQPIYNSSLQRWKNYEKFLGPLKKVLKYDE